MEIFIEGESYPLELLERVFDDPKFYKINGTNAILSNVGYYHSFEKNTLVFVLPKVFMKDGSETVFDITKEELVGFIQNISIKHKKEYNWVRHLSIYFYKSLIEYRNRRGSLAVSESETIELSTNLGRKEYSYLDILLSIVNFYKKNKQQILFKHIEFISNQAQKPKWEKTIRKTLPMVTNSSSIIYNQIANKRKTIHAEEELITYFFSILNKLNNDHYLNIKIDKSFKIIKGRNFEILCINGISKLKKIKHRYFSDVLRRMYFLCEMYFTLYDRTNLKRKKEDFLAISNYNLVFEDMIDKLFSDELSQENALGITIDQLKMNDDGKIIDHIYDYKSLIDTSDIYYIGDSKYYKSNSEAGKTSRYKQFTYAKNVIQFNIDLLNRVGEEKMKPLRYRDSLTEGYNISPNFFIYGYIDDISNYEHHRVERRGKTINSFHFHDRLFDRDTLFVQQYKINFLFVLKSYTASNILDIKYFRREIKESFRNNFIEFFNDASLCGFQFYNCTLPIENYEEFINNNFKHLNGKCFLTSNNTLILARHSSDDTICNHILCHFKEITNLFD